MTPLIQLWIASAAGAALFFSVGFLLARVTQRAEQALAEGYLLRLRTELEHAHSGYAAQGREVDHLEHRAQRAEQSASELSDALAHARAECVRLDKELAGRTLSAERSSVLEVDKRRLEETAQDNARWQARAELDEAAKRAQAAEGQLAELSQELERLRQEQREGARRMQRLSTRAARLDAQEKDNAQLKKQCESMSNELHRLRQSLSEGPGARHSERSLVGPASRLSERSSVGAPPSSPTSGPQLVVPPAPRIASVGHAPDPAHATERGLAAILERQLSMLMVGEPDVTAVLSDEHGLALVGLGSVQDQEHVSVLTSIARDLAARTRALIGFERIESLEIVEGGGRALRVRFFEWADQPLALGYLGARRLLHSEAEERMVSSFPPLRIVHSA